MTSKTILFLAIAAVLITGTLSVDQAAFADKDDKDNKSKKVQVKTRDSNGDAVKDTTCLVEWRGGDSGPIKTNRGGVAKLQVPSDVTAVKATCGDGDTRSSATADLKDKGTTSINVIFEAEPETDPFDELWKAIDRIANVLKELQSKDMELMEKDTEIMDTHDADVLDLQSQIDTIGTGSQGPKGEDGDDCSILDTAEGADVTCGEETVSLFDGEQGPQHVNFEVIRFDAGNHQTINANPGFFINGNYEGSPLNGFVDFRRGATLAGIDGEITELRYDIGAGVLNGFTTTVSLWKNNVVIGSCSVVTTTTPSNCTVSLAEPVLAGDLIAVSHESPQGDVAVDFFHAAAVITTSNP